MSDLPLAFLLGAGASYPYGIPVMAGFYSAFRTELSSKHRECMPLLERLETRRTLSDLETLLTDLDLVTRTREGLGLLGGDATALDDAFEQASDLRGFLDAFIVDRCENFERERSAREFGSVVQLSEIAPVWVFSTNYDRIIENACDQAGLRYDDGYRVSTASPLADWTGVFDAPVRLVKLHGSVNWYEEVASQELHRLDRGYALPSKDFHLFRGEQQLRPLMIIPTLEKEALGLPYIRLGVSFTDALQRSLVLIVLGSSLRDAHIRAWIQSRMGSLRVVVVGPTASQTAAAFRWSDRVHTIEAGASEFLTLGGSRLRELATSLASAESDPQVETAVRTFAETVNRVVLTQADLGTNPRLAGLLSRSRSDQPWERADAARRLEDHPHPAVRERLSEILQLDPDPAVRVAAIHSLVTLAGQQAVDLLARSLLEDPAHDVQLEAALALLAMTPSVTTARALDSARVRLGVSPALVRLLASNGGELPIPN